MSSGETLATDSQHIAQLKAMREEHVGRLLQHAYRNFNTRAVAKLRQRGHTGLTLAHTLLLSHLGLEGTRITVLAERAGITKQSMGQLAIDLEKHGYVERRPDPTDGRAILMHFTDLGWRFLEDSFAIKREIESEYQAILGEQGFDQLKAALNQLIDAEIES